MPAFKRFGPGDQTDNVLILQPRYDLVSGTQGWRGSPEGSASLSLYGGARRRPGVFSSIQYQSFAPNVGQTGNPTLGQPLTASVNAVYMTNEPRPLGQVSSTRWGKEHWDVTMRLYQDYHVVSPEYVTSSYDYYCLYFNGNSANAVVGSTFDFFGSPVCPSGSFTLESWAKPFSVTDPSRSFTLQAFDGIAVFGITGSTGRLFLSSSFGSVTSSIAVTNNRWSHLAVAYNSSSLSGNFYVNLQDAGSFVMSQSLPVSAGWISVGCIAPVASSGRVGTAFNGFIGETRSWNLCKTQPQLSSSYSRQLALSELTGGLSYFRFAEGPLWRGFTSAAVVPSGTVDLCALARGTSFVITFLDSFTDRSGPTWHPNDNVSFFPNKRTPESVSFTYLGADRRAIVSPAQRMLVVDVPSAFYGRQIVPGSVRMTCRAYESYGLIRTLVDDGRGGLYLSGSASSSSLVAKEDYAGVGWNKVGNVFYGEGLIVVKDPALLDFGRTDGAALVATDTLQLSFRGDSRIPVKTLMCRVDRGEFNCTNNPTFFVTGSAGERLARHPSGSIRATTVGIYNSDRELVAVARLADPVRIRARDRLNIRIRLDF